MTVFYISKKMRLANREMMEKSKRGGEEQT